MGNRHIDMLCPWLKRSWYYSIRLKSSGRTELLANKLDALAVNAQIAASQARG
jgi:hypothetical protein